LAELQGVLSRDKFIKQLARRRLTVADVFDGYAALVSIVTPANITPTIARDPADDQVLAAALAASADLIVSGDAHLLDLKSFLGISIINAAQAAARLQWEPSLLSPVASRASTSSPRPRAVERLDAKSEI
jgi:uncharacterized protein